MAKNTAPAAPFKSDALAFVFVRPGMLRVISRERAMDPNCPVFGFITAERAGWKLDLPEVGRFAGPQFYDTCDDAKRAAHAALTS